MFAQPLRTRRDYGSTDDNEIVAELVKIAKILVSDNWDDDDEDEEDEDDGFDFQDLKYNRDKHVTKLKMSPEWSSPKVQEYGPRPQGYQVKDKDLKIVFHKTDKWSKLKSKVSSLSYSDYSDIEHDKIALEYACLIVTNVSVQLDNLWKTFPANERKYIVFNDGWDSSYHDANWNGVAFILAFGNTQQEAEKRGNDALSIMKKAKDPGIKRHELKNLVRRGD